MNTLHNIKTNSTAKLILPQVARFVSQYGAEYLRLRREKRHRDLATKYVEQNRPSNPNKPAPAVIKKGRNPILLTLVGILVGVAAGIGLSKFLPSQDT